MYGENMFLNMKLKNSNLSFDAIINNYPNIYEWEILFNNFNIRIRTKNPYNYPDSELVWADLINVYPNCESLEFYFNQSPIRIALGNNTIHLDIVKMFF
jgi:hypothetical protein